MDAHKATENEEKKALTLVKRLSDHAIARWIHLLSHRETFFD